jgi:hypothetical protein
MDDNVLLQFDETEERNELEDDEKIRDQSRTKVGRYNHLRIPHTA